jgi:Pectate lyase superfamily protein
MKIKFYLLYSFFVLNYFIGYSQTNKNTTDIVVLDIKKFGAKGDGKTNDFLAFQKASTYINSRGGNAKLIIGKGNYVINSQESEDLSNLDVVKRYSAICLVDCNNIEIKGEGVVKIIYASGQQFGSFDPITKLKYTVVPNYDVKYRREIGSFIYLRNVNNISIDNLKLNGNITKMEIGGPWGDIGIQLIHDAILAFECNNVSIKNIVGTNFGRDGIMIGNTIKPNNTTSNNISLQNCEFTYNGRQGLSWIGGKGLVANNCKFNYTGMNGAVSSLPTAGVDIEAELGIIQDGVFNNCEMIGNGGTGLVADSGPSENVTINNCTIVGYKSWATWTRKPRYVYNNCSIYGCPVNAYNSKTEQEGTQYNNCRFSDVYKGTTCYGRYLVEFNSAGNLRFQQCVFTTSQKKLLWIDGTTLWTENEKTRFTNCNFIIKSINNISDGDFLFVARTSSFRNCNFKINIPKSKMRGIWIQNAGSTWGADISVNYAAEN